MRQISRRSLLAGASGTAGLLALGALAGCSSPSAVIVGPSSPAVRRAEAARRPANQRLVAARLTARPATVDLGGLRAQTWAYGDTVPGPLLRARAGDLVRVRLDNALPADTSIHWHGVALRNDMDGVPGITQGPVAPRAGFTYEFTAPDPGTYFYHPHSGLQLDRGLYGALVVEDPSEPGDYDDEWVVVLDDWLDGTGRTPEDVLSRLRAGAQQHGRGMPGMSDGPMGDMGPMGGMDHGSMGGLGGMDHGSMGGMGQGAMAKMMRSRLLGGAGDVNYPHYLLNGRTSDAPTTFPGRAGQRVRIRIVNAGSDTAFRVALGGHRMTVTHSDGFPVVPQETDGLLIGMGERYDVVVTLEDGVFPLVALPEGKRGQALALVRIGPGRAPTSAVRPAELSRRVVLGSDLEASTHARLRPRAVDRRHTLALGGTMAPYRWTINGDTFPTAPLPVVAGERLRVRLQNQTMMFHPMHVHGHTFALVRGGVRKDTVIVPPMQTVDVDVDADNPGRWAVHCHNIYHAEAGMMTTLAYRL